MLPRTPRFLLTRQIPELESTLAWCSSLKAKREEQSLGCEQAWSQHKAAVEDSKRIERERREVAERNERERREAAEKPWSCPACTVVNPAANAKCSMCDLQRGAKPPQQAQSVWACSACGIADNKYAANGKKGSCQVCAANGDHPPPKVPQWQCSACTYLCNAGVAACPMCGTAKPRSGV